MGAWQEVVKSDGAVSRCALVCGPSDTSMFERMVEAGLKPLDIPYSYETFQIPGEEFDDCIRHLHASGFKGAHIGNPHKVFAGRIAERYYMVRNSMGLANALSFSGGIFGKNTEVSGFAQTLTGIEPGLALVMGAGQAARSVVMGLFEAGWKIRVWNRSAMKSRLLQTTFGRFGSLELTTQADPSGCRLAINATPVGLKAGEQPPLVWRYANPKLICYDLVYRRVQTEFLRSAAVRGLKTIDGRELLVEQAAEALEWWLGTPMPREPMRLAVGLRARIDPALAWPDEN